MKDTHKQMRLASKIFILFQSELSPLKDEKFFHARGMSLADLNFFVKQKNAFPVFFSVRANAPGQVFC